MNPAMDTIGAYLDALAQNTFDREAFLAQNKVPFLVTVETMDDALPGGMTPEGATAATVAHDPQKLRRASIAAREARVYAIAKREGVNADKAILVGRARDNDVWINDSEVSKHHAKVTISKGEYSICDVGSTNGTFINDRKIELEKPVAVHNYDAVRLGRAQKMQFLDAESFFDYLTVLRRFVGI
jgi:hypothetical protein